MLLSTLTTCMLLYVLRLHSAQGRHNFEMGFDSCECNRSDPDGYLAYQSCGVSKNIKRRSFQYEIELKRDLKIFFMNMRLSLPRQNGEFVLFNLTNVNVCQLLSQQNQILFLQLSIQSLKRYGNFPTNCPFYKNVRYYLKGFRLDLNAIPAVTFETNMNFWFEYVVENKKILQCLIRAHIFLKRKSKGRK